MKNEDKEAFGKWFKDAWDIDFDFDAYDFRHTIQVKVWQAACEYKQKEIDELQAKNERLKEVISYLPKVPTQPHEKELSEKIKNLEKYVDRLEVALEKYAGHLGVLNDK